MIVVGTHHYNPELSMPLLADELERFGFKTTVVLPKGDPEMNKNGEGLPGLDVLNNADVAIFFMRFLTLSDEQLKPLMDYVRSGKPVVGFRTSTHSFNYQKDHPNDFLNLGFGRNVLGTKYIVHQSGSTTIEKLDSAKNHPVLTGVGDEPFVSPGTLYLTSLQPGCEPLLLGAGSRNGTRMVKNQFGTFFIEEEERDIVAWTWTNNFGARTFSTSLGHVGDFAVEPSMRVIVNGMCWAAGVEVPAASTKINTFDIPDPRKAKKK
ncbi:MAG: ThuA domain-containing protein [Planctomycetota bacterium]